MLHFRHICGYTIFMHVELCNKVWIGSVKIINYHGSVIRHSIIGRFANEEEAEWMVHFDGATLASSIRLLHQLERAN